MTQTQMTLREQAEEAWVEHVRPMKQRLFFESEREEWITAWLERQANYQPSPDSEPRG